MNKAKRIFRRLCGKTPLDVNINNRVSITHRLMLVLASCLRAAGLLTSSTGSLDTSFEDGIMWVVD